MNSLKVTQSEQTDSLINKSNGTFTFMLWYTLKRHQNAPTTEKLSQKGSKSSDQGQEVWHTIYFPLYVYIVKNNHGHYNNLHFVLGA